MITAEDGTGRTILSEGGDPRAAYSGMSALSPVLFGLTLPLVVFMLLTPVAFKSAGPVLIVLLVLLFIVAFIVFVVSTFVKGPVAALAIKPGDRHLEIYRAGPFATSQMRIPVRDVRDVLIATHYDDDGYAWRLPQLVLDDGSKIDLPFAVDASDISRFRQALGLKAQP